MKVVKKTEARVTGQLIGDNVDKNICQESQHNDDLA